MTTYLEFLCGGGVILTEGDLSARATAELHRVTCRDCQRYADLYEHRDDTHRDIATMHDVDAKWQNKVADDMDEFPLEISGDALAIHSAKDQS